MKWILLSDIHANLVALEAVFEDIEQRFPGFFSDKSLHNARIVSLGDQIGYNPYPNEVMDCIWNIADVILIGNHEKSVVKILNEVPLRGCTLEAQWAMRWTAKVLNSQNRDRLIELIARHSYLTRVNNVCFTHARPDAPEDMQYINTIEDAQSSYLWSNDSTQVCFVGHTHTPKIYTCISGLSAQVCIPTNSAGMQSFDLSGVEKAMVVAPSVGQPRDASICTGYCIYDVETGILHLIRLPYNIRKVQSTMEEFNFPRDLIERLCYGD